MFAQQSTRLITGWQFLRQDLGGIWEAVRPLTKNGPETVPVWQSVSLPHCINAEDAVDATPNYYQGAAWYRTQLNINNPYDGGRTLLHFEGAGQKTEVYIYTTKVGAHTGGYDEFTIDITDAVDSFKKLALFQSQFNGQIPVSIKTDNSRDLEMIPSNMSDFVVYGGLYRYVNLVYVPPASIKQLFASAHYNEKTGEGRLSAKLSLYNPEKIKNVSVTATLFDASGKLVDQSASVSDSINLQISNFTLQKATPWSPDEPYLYHLQITVSDGKNSFSQTEAIGFRSFEFQDKGPFFLNGKRLLLKGTHRHEDAAGVGAALTEEAIRKELLQIKEMGANFIRLGHYQQSRLTLQFCDSLGLLVWEEIPWCRGGLGGEAYQQQAKQMLTNMIDQHYNHPSIIIWGLGNENDWSGDFSQFDKEAIRTFMHELNDLAHNLDSSRKTAIRRCDFCKDIVDVYSPTIWMGWYRGIFTDYKKASEEEAAKVNHFLHAEWGGDSHAGRHSERIDSLLLQTLKGQNLHAGNDTVFASFAKASKNNDWSETYICNLFDWHLKEQLAMPWLTGSAMWTFKDFATPLRPENPVPYVNQKGVVERDGAIKESFYVFQSYWATKPMLHIYGHSWPIRWGGVGEEKLLKVYSNCEEVEFFLNGKSCGVKKRNPQLFPAAGFYWMVSLRKGKNVVKAIGRKEKAIVKDEISFTYQIEKWGLPSHFLLKKKNESATSITVEATLVDKKNVPCLDAASPVKFAIAGDGRLIENQGSTKGSSTVQLCNGMAQITINKNGGHSTLSLSADNLPASFLNF